MPSVEMKPARPSTSNTFSASSRAMQQHRRQKMSHTIGKTYKRKKSKSIIFQKSMAQLSRDHHPRTPTSATAPTIDHILRATSSPRWSSHSSHSFREHDFDDDHHSHHHHKKSVLTKVKERAKKLRQSLSKKRLGDGEPTTPTGGVRFFEDAEETDEEEADAEYLGAPMYESELAPESYKVTAKQHPRAVFSEKNVLPCGKSFDMEHEKDQKSPGKSKATSEATKTNSESGRDSSTRAETSIDNAKKLHKGLTVSFKETSEKNAGQENEKDKKNSPNKSSLAKDQKIDSGKDDVANVRKGLTVSVKEPSKKPAAEETEKESPNIWEKTGISKEKIWDKGVSVKEYIMHKLEPGEDEKALSEVITEAISPKSSGDNVVEKVKEAVNSFLWSEKPAQSNANNNNNSYSASNSSASIPVSTNAQDDMEEESHGRILQAN